MLIKTLTTGKSNSDDVVKSPYAALRFSLRCCGVRLKYVSLLRLRAPCLWNFLRRRPFHSKGYTLVELLLVIILIGVILVLAVPSTNDALTFNKLKKASRQLIGLERKLRVEAVRDQTDYILYLDLQGSLYWVETPDMTPEKRALQKKDAAHLPAGVIISAVVGENNIRQSAAEVKIKFGKHNLCTPAIIHLAYEENKMTLVINPYLGITDIYDKYVDVSTGNAGSPPVL